MTNRTGKTYVLIGSTINYGVNRNSFKVVVKLDLESRSMVIYLPNNPNGEVFTHLQEGPLYPAF